MLGIHLKRPGLGQTEVTYGGACFLHYAIGQTDTDDLSTRSNLPGRRNQRGTMPTGHVQNTGARRQLRQVHQPLAQDREVADASIDCGGSVEDALKGFFLGRGVTVHGVLFRCP